MVTSIAACARPVRPDEMSAQAHRREAAVERAAADAQARKFDPNAQVSSVTVSCSPGGAVGVADAVFTDYNPTTWRLGEAERHHAHALEHEHAAAALDAFEDDACRPFASGVRAACPFMGPISSIDEIDGGVRLHFAGHAPIAAHMRCHLAFARTRAFRVSECPLTLPRTEARVALDGTAIEVTTDDRKTTRELRKRAQALTAPVK